MHRDNCPCGSGKPYGECCAPLHQRKTVASTAEALMRSRYCAYVLGDAKYLYRSWDEATRPALQSLRSMPPIQWVGLEIVRVEKGGEEDQVGLVEFVARYLQEGQMRLMQESSRFRRAGGRWVYVDAAQPREL